MFTGLIETQGMVASASGGRFAIRAPWRVETLLHGASIACDGCCLTVTDAQAEGSGSVFLVDVSPETLSKTMLGEWQAGRAINLERSLKLGDELGGHLVSGHVDGVAVIERIDDAGNAKVFSVRAPDGLAKYIAPKGSVALDGISLTVNAVEGSLFTLALIPTTLQVTTWGAKRAGDRVNLEVDMIARYVARLLDR
jgi:riboflavin synthase